MTTLELENLAVDCIIGDLPEERVKEQRVRLDIALEIDENASRSDALEDTLDYAELSRRLSAALKEAKCRMIERAARLALDICLNDGKVRKARVKVTKTGAIECLEAASVTLVG